MPKNDHDRAIALAGLFQASKLVRDIARHGRSDSSDFATCINSVFKINADDSEDVYGSLLALRNGLLLVDQQMRNPQDAELTRYVLSLLALERKLRKKPALLERLSAAIDAAAAKLAHFEPTHENIIASLADVYVSTISTLTPRIMVNGEHMHLSKPENANRIRALLLAGVRAAFLWRQSGGNWLTLLLKRKALAAETQRLLARLERPTDA